MTFIEIVKKIAEQYREEAKEHECATIGEYWRDVGDYETEDVRGEIYYCLTHYFPQADFFDFDRKNGIWVHDDGSFEFWNGIECEYVPFRKISSAIRKFEV